MGTLNQKSYTVIGFEMMFKIVWNCFSTSKIISCFV